MIVILDYVSGTFIPSSRYWRTRMPSGYSYTVARCVKNSNSNLYHYIHVRWRVRGNQKQFVLHKTTLAHLKWPLCDHNKAQRLTIECRWLYRLYCDVTSYFWGRCLLNSYFDILLSFVSKIIIRHLDACSLERWWGQMVI